VRIYLTNALEPWQRQLKLPDFEALAHEAAAVNEVKREKRFTVVIGNPPYSGASVNMSDHAQSLVDRYRFIAGKRIDEVKLWLQNDYIKFIAFAHGAIEYTGVGVLGFITDNSYLDGPTFRGVRYGLATTFANLRVLDLHGSSKRRDRTELGSADENVFDITQGVSVVLGVSKHGQKESPPSYSDVSGSREDKYALLIKGNFTFLPVHWTPPFYLLVESDHSLREEYDIGIRITDVFVAKGNGFMTGRDGFVIGFTRSEIESRINDFFNLDISDEEIRHRYEISDYRAFKIAEVRRTLKFQQSRVVEASYRPLDQRWTYFQRPIIQEWQSSVHTHMFGRENRALCVGRAGNVLGGTWDICFCTKRVTDLNQFYRGGNVSLPIYRFPEEGDLLDAPEPNFTHDFVIALGRTLGLPLVKSGLPKDLTPEDIFHYAYAVFHSPGYRTRYAEFLKIDFPRLPLPRNLELFRALSHLGGELVALHLLESPKLDQPITEFVGGKNPEVEKPSWSENTVWVNKAQTTGFKGVRENVWNFHIGGYQVCQKWLKDRKGRMLSKDDIAHYQKIVIALSETIRLMAEIDRVIETHGGWPDAFASAAGQDANAATDEASVEELIAKKVSR
jgi:predicted helicase